MAAESIPSAVAVPEIEPELTSSTNDLKRRQSEKPELEQESKRQRTSPGKNDSPKPEDKDNGAREAEDGGLPPSQDIADTRQPRWKTSVADEKQRNKRLFGALLGNLNQPGDSRASKRRQEIESRKKAELQRQDDEHVEDIQRRREKITEAMKREQERVDDEYMQTRHRNMLNTANYLQTKTEPILHYRPWDLRPDEEDRIEEQIKEARARIDEDLDQFEQRYGRKSQSDTRPTANVQPSDDKYLKPDPTGAKDLEVESGRDTGSEGPVEDSASAKSTTVTGEAPKPAEVPDSDEEAADPPTNTSPIPTDPKQDDVENETQMEKPAGGDHANVVDGEEDTVIY